MNKRLLFYSLPIILLLIVAVAGWFATDYLGNKARQEIISESQASVLTLSTYVSSTFTNIEGAVKSLAGSPWIVPVLLSKRDQDIEHANSALDRYNSAINASVSYLMNAEGLTVASSNRKDPDSFVGKSYYFRPYFQEAAQGKPGHYFGLGMTSEKRGFYASNPVRNRLGKVLGVVAMKKDLDDMGTFFRKYPFCFLISPDGIIFLSSKPSMVLKSFWPPDKTAQKELIASQQFGNKLFETVYFKKEITDGTEVTLEGKDYFVARKVIDSDGWSIMLLTATDRISNYKLVGILITIGICSLIIFFSVVIYVTVRSKAAIEQSENKYRMLADNISDVIFVLDMNLKYTYISPSVKTLRGYEPEEVLKQASIETMTPSSKELVSKTMSEAMELEKSERRDISISRTLQIEVKRKDGTTVWTEMKFSFIRDEDQRPIGIMGVTRDITERRQAEETLKESESRLRAITDSAQDAILMMDPEGLISYWNPAAERIFGYTSAEVIGQNLHSLIVPSRYQEAHHAAFPVFQQTGQGAAVGKTLDLAARRKDGKEISVQLSLAAIHMKDAWHAVGVLRDITERKQAEEALKKMGAILTEMGQIAKIGGWEFDAASQKQVWTQEVYHIHEVDESYEPTVSKGIEFYAPASRPVMEKALQRAVEYGDPFDVELEIITAKGNRRWVHAKGNTERENGITKKVFGFFQDITNRKRAEEALKCSETKFRTLYDSNSDAVMLLNKQGFFDCNKAALTMFGCATMEEFCLKHPADLSPTEQPDGADSRVLANQMIATAMEKGSIQFEWRHKRNDTGDTFPADVLFTAMELNGKPVVQAVVRDITERKQTEEKIRQMAYHDSLTGLPNRKLFSDRLGIALAQSQRSQQKVGIAMLDLDKFKDVNDTLGHDAGDLLLQATAERLSAALRKGDTVARFGGDEFVLIFPDIKGIEDVSQVAQKIVDSFRKPFLIGTRQLAVTTSIGIAVYPDDGTDEGTILKNADIAMYQAKQAGRARYQFYGKV